MVHHSKDPPRNQTTLPDEPLPTIAKGPHPQPPIHLPPTPNLPTLCTLFTEASPNNLWLSFQKQPLLNQNQPIRQNATHKVPQKGPTSLSPDTNDSSHNDQPLAALSEHHTHWNHHLQQYIPGLFETVFNFLAFQDHMKFF